MKKTTIIRGFTHEVSLVVSAYGGYVLKYLGDAILAFFVVPDKSDQYMPCTNAVYCARSMVRAVKEGFNVILNQEGYLELADSVEQASREYIPPALQDTRCGALIKKDGLPRHRFYGSLPQKGSKDKEKKLLEFESIAEHPFVYTTVVNAFELYKGAFKARDPKMELARADALLDAFFSCLHLTERLCKVCRCVPT